LIPNRLGCPVGGPEKAGVGGSIRPVLPTVEFLQCPCADISVAIRSFGTRTGLCPIGDDLEEHLGSDLGQGNLAHLIEGDQVPLLSSGESAAELAVVAGFDEFVDESGDGGEADALVLTACFDTECGHQVSLAGAGVAEQDDRLGAIQIAAVNDAYRPTPTIPDTTYYTNGTNHSVPAAFSNVIGKVEGLSPVLEGAICNGIKAIPPVPPHR
jgi:hypothetical protein